MQRFSQIILLMAIALGFTFLPIQNPMRAQIPQLTSELTYVSGGQVFAVTLGDGTSTSKGNAPPEPNVVDAQNNRFWVDSNQSDEKFFRIMQSAIDGSNPQALLTSQQFYAQFPNYNEHPYNQWC